jgi:ubiquinone/menaquinone biosynthesis C-methylase UbiE
MIKTKTFQFLISNAAGNDVHHDDDLAFIARVNKNGTPLTECEIDKKINTWIKKEQADVVDIKVTPYTVDRHNNGRHDTVILTYTILYRETKKEA